MVICFRSNRKQTRSLRVYFRAWGDILNISHEDNYQAMTETQPEGEEIFTGAKNFGGRRSFRDNPV